jgi:hypothetical protein
MLVPLQGCPMYECRLTCIRMQWVHWSNCALCPLLAVSCGDAGFALFTLTVSSPRMDYSKVRYFWGFNIRLKYYHSVCCWRIRMWLESAVNWESLCYFRPCKSGFNNRIYGTLPISIYTNNFRFRYQQDEINISMPNFFWQHVSDKRKNIQLKYKHLDIETMDNFL